MYLGVDLGSTNIKAAIYDGSMQLVGQQSRPVESICGKTAAWNLTRAV